MRLTNHTPRLPKKMPPPGLDWQTDDFARVQEFRFHLPYAFLLLCKIWDTTPEEIIYDFMENLSNGNHKRKISELAKPHLQQYIIEMGYGQQRHYKIKHIEAMFKELEAIGMLWPENAKMKMIQMHTQWRDKYYNWWFKKWYNKPHRTKTNDDDFS
jgi:hypothetical protein